MSANDTLLKYFTSITEGGKSTASLQQSEAERVLSWVWL